MFVESLYTLRIGIQQFYIIKFTLTGMREKEVLKFLSKCKVKFDNIDKRNLKVIGDVLLAYDLMFALETPKHI